MTRASKTLLALLAAAALAGAAMAQSNGPVVLDEGTWTTGNYAIQGEWRIVEEAGETVLLLGEDFRTQRAPDLKIFLSPLALDEIEDANATEGSLLVSKLARPKGAQRYVLPDDLELSGFASLIIHCERFSKYWGGTALEIDGA